MSQHSHEHNHDHEADNPLYIKVEENGEEKVLFRFVYFVFLWLFQVIGLLSFSYWFSKNFLNETFHAATFPNLFTFQALLVLGVTLFCAKFVVPFLEWLFHRYFLHKKTLGIKVFYKAHHVEHHGITKETLDEKTQYPIDRWEKVFKATFPRFTTSIFWAAGALIGLGPQILLPGWPICLPLALSFAIGVGRYEIIHALNHYPDEWWRRQCSKTGWYGRYMREKYVCHKVHHFNPVTNLNISDSFADRVLDTYRYVPALVDKLLGHEVKVTDKEIRAHINRRPNPRIKTWLTKLFRRSPKEVPASAE